MDLCGLSLGLSVVAALVAAFSLTDGGVRHAIQMSLARRCGRVFTPSLIVVGDSLAACCPWRGLFFSPFAVLNMAAGGAVLGEIGAQIYRARDIRTPWLLIDGGLNDLLFDGAAPERIEADFLALSRRIGDRVKVVVTLMPHVSDRLQRTRIDDANARIARLCAERGYAVIDLNPHIAQDGARRPEMTYDGLHFSRAAEQIWRDAVRGILQDK